MNKKSKVKKSKERETVVSWGKGFALNSNAPDRINGSLFQLIETMGLPEKQEEAVKGHIRGIVWKEFNEKGVHLTSNTYSDLVEKKIEFKNDPNSTQGSNQFIEI